MLSLRNITQHPLRVMYISGFLYALHLALTLYINSSYLSQYFSESLVGLLFSIGSIIALCGLYITPHIIASFSEQQVLRRSLFLGSLLLLGIGFLDIPWVIAILFPIYLGFNTIILFNIDVTFNNMMSMKNIGKIRGLFLTLKHIALMAIPSLAGIIIDHIGFSMIYILAGILLSTIGLIVTFIKNFPEKEYREKSLFASLSYVIKSHHTRTIIIINFLLQFFYAWMIIYIPLYLSYHHNMTWGTIGSLITLMLIAFVILEYPLGKFIDRYGGLRSILILGFFIMILSVTAIPFIQTNSFWVWALVLFSTRVGAALVELITESYFYTHTNPADISLMSIFYETNPLAYLVAPIIASALLNNFAFITIFFVLACILTSGIYYAWTLPKNSHITYENQ